MFTLLLNYNFFDDKYTLGANGYHGEDKLSLKQFIVMGVLFLLIIAISILLRKVKKEKVFLVYKILSIVMPLGEIAKISFETYFDLQNGQPFNLGGILPLYACSMLLYFLPFVAWGKGGKMQRFSMAFFTTIGMVAGLSNFVYLSAAGFYPLFSFGGMYSIIFHAVIVFVGISLMCTGIYMPKDYKTIYEAMIPVGLMAVVVIPANFIIKTVPGNEFVDYMLFMNANGFVEPLSNWFINNNIQLLFSFLMLFVIYPIATAAITYIDIGIGLLVKLISRGFKKKKEPVESQENE